MVARTAPAFFLFSLILAILLSEKHETRPSTLKMTKFNETLDLLKSASAWDKFSLVRFGVEFEKTYNRVEHSD